MKTVTSDSDTPVVSLSRSVAGPVLETRVQEDVDSVLLQNLLSGTEYSVQVTASYLAGPSGPVLVNTRTSESL